MLSRYIDRAHALARDQELEDGATVPGLRGVIATGRAVEACRNDVAAVIEGSILVRVAKGVVVPPLRGAPLQVRISRAERERG